jgi:hypothetical protein
VSAAWGGEAPRHCGAGSRFPAAGPYGAGEISMQVFSGRKPIFLVETTLFLAIKVENHDLLSMPR